MKKLKIAFILVLLCTGTCLLVSCHRGTNRQELEGADVQNLEDTEAQANDDPAGIPQGDLVELISPVLNARPTDSSLDWCLRLVFLYNPFGDTDQVDPDVAWLSENVTAKLFKLDGRLISQGFIGGGIGSVRGPEYYSTFEIVFEALIPKDELDETYSIWVGSKSGDKTWISETYDVRRLAPYPK